MEESYIRSVIRRFTYHKAGMISLAVVVLIVLAALLAPVLTPYGYEELAGAVSQPPGDGHLLGTDAIGRDMFARLLYGTRVSLLVGFLATALSTALGVVLGLVAGYFGGVWDMILMRFTDMVMSFPYILLVLVASVIFRPGMWNVILILGFVDWTGVARLVRGNVLAMKDEDFVKAAKIAGLPKRRLLFSEILPNVIAPVLVFATSVMALSILDEAALSFLGMGVQPPQPSLGNLLNGAQSLTVLGKMPWLWLPPGLTIVVLVVCVNFVGDALRDAVDPTTIK